MRVAGIASVSCIVLCVVLLTASPAWSNEAAVAGGIERGAGEQTCQATANCWNGTHVSCTGNDSCVPEDSDCPEVRGKVVCDRVTTYCPPCMTEGCTTEGGHCYSDLDCLAGYGPDCLSCYCHPYFFFGDSGPAELPPPDLEGYCVCP